MLSDHKIEQGGVSHSHVVDTRELELVGVFAIYRGIPVVGGELYHYCSSRRVKC